MRDKEGKQDYRFMPEPNLPPLIVYDNESVKGAPSVDTAVNIDELRARLPELPEAQRQRLMDDYGIKMESAIKLVVSAMMVGHRGDLVWMGVCCPSHKTIIHFKSHFGRKGCPFLLSPWLEKQ